MLDTLIKIGKIQSQGKSDWEAKIYNPPNKTLLVLLIFDIDEQKIKIDTEAFDSQRAIDFRCLKPAGARAKNALVTVDVSKNFEQFKKSLFGSGESESGEFMEIIKRDCPQIEQTKLGAALLKVFDMKTIFENYVDTEGYFKSKNNVLAAVIQSKELGIEEPKALAILDGFEDFAKIKILKTETLDEGKERVEKMCYATGELHDDVSDVDFSNRFSLNKMFVTTTKNYLSEFQDGNSAGSYQVSSQNQKLLEAGSKFVLDNWQIRIADVNHCILPRTFGDVPLNDKVFRTHIKPTTDILFGFENIKDVVRQAKRKQDLLWLTFMAYESDGNFFKALNIIQDINGLYLNKIADTFLDTHDLFSEMQGRQWERIMSYKKDGEMVTPNFNFQTIYGCIPLRKDKEKKNVALALFKSILEQRSIDRHQLFEYFSELMLCHRYKRYTAYKNIYPNDKFNYYTEKAVFQYMALIQVLNELKLFKDNKKDLEMENQEKSISSVPDASNQVESFFIKMNYNSQQKAMFYLGRILNWIGFAQESKEHESKPILGHVNYNGMDYKAIVRLKKELFLKMKQYHKFKNNGKIYNLFKRCEPLFDQFEKHFELNHRDAKSWGLNREETLFYLLSGYSFRIEKESSIDDDNQ
jgi:CRISPR-associated protein Csh1